MRPCLTLLSLLVLTTPSWAQHVLTEVFSSPDPNADLISRRDAVFLGDIDQDGRDDFVIADPSFGDTLPRVGRVRAFSGASGAVLWEVQGTVAQESLGYFGIGNGGLIDGDNIPDLLITTFMGAPFFVRSGADGSLLSDGTGVLTSASRMAGAGDVDGDSVADYLVSAGDLFLFSGATHSLIRTHVNTSGRPWGLLLGLGDVDGDGRGDYVGQRRCIPNTITVGCNTGYQAFSGASGTLLYQDLSFSNDAYFPGSSRLRMVGDFDGDGSSDFSWVHVVAAFGTQLTQSKTIVSGATGMTLHSFQGGGYLDQEPLAGVSDLNGDGRNELLVVNYQSLSFFDDSFEPALAVLDADSLLELFRITLPFPYVMDEFVVPSTGGDAKSGGDANGDGYQDILVPMRNRDLGGPTDGLSRPLQVFSGRAVSIASSLCFGDSGGGRPAALPVLVETTPWGLPT